MDAIFFKEQTNLGLDFIKIIIDDSLIKDKFEHYPNLLEDENIFLEPFLIAHYHQPTREISQSLDQLLLGYIKKEKLPESIDVRSDVNGAIYLPGIGYLHTGVSHENFVLNINKNADNPESKYNLVLEGKKVAFDFEGFKFVPDTNIEIYRHSHEYIVHKLGNDELFTNVFSETESPEWVDKHSKTMVKAFDIIKEVDPQQFAELTELTKKVVFFKADRFVNFTSMELQGVIFFSTYESATELTFMDTLVHEVSHLALNSILINTQDFFTVDPYELKFKSPFRKELRGLYQSLHATYVLAKLIRFFNNLYKAKVFTGIKEYELLGLFLLDIKLLSEALTYIGDRSHYTDAGWEILEEIKNVYHTVSEERKDIIDKYKLPRVAGRNASVTPKDFEVDAFLEANNLSREVLGLVA